MPSRPPDHASAGTPTLPEPILRAPGEISGLDTSAISGPHFLGPNRQLWQRGLNAAFLARHLGASFPP